MSSSIIQSPQAPGDIMPIPWRRRSLADIGFPTKAIQDANANGIFTLEELVASNRPLETFSGIGAVTAQKIAGALQGYREADT